ncbi:MAG: haloacid dehalogenase-like hydrolase [candidate division WS6 bacterium OLB20]|uniref:Haloacid dehalogenase-like hydrolase n=1 Tax=candidate division WS6 bacterium OLB20 TaxID=1617426 RepID=A0A136LW10_9BACT|nr:MAG: haloacid dehalogenase-like hydrolase [candidate division WS6 bacterium OLB20]
MSVAGIYWERRRIEDSLGRLSSAAGKDHEYVLQEVLEQLLRALLPDTGTDFAAEADRFTDLEIEHEQLVTYPDSRALRLLGKVKAETCILLSDFYMTSQQLARIVQKHIDSDLYNTLITSADSLRNKVSGEAFRQVMDTYKVKPHEYLHIGDSLPADIEGAAKAGVRSLRFSNEGPDRRKHILGDKFNKRINREFAYRDEFARALATVKPSKPLSSEQRRLYDAGVRYAPLFYFYVQSTIETALRYGIDAVYYFTREGVFFKNVHHEIQKNNPLGLELPEARLLEVSRVATFGASVTEVSTKELMRIWNLYKQQSWKGLFKSLDVPVADYKEHFARHLIDPDEVIEIARHEKSLTLLKDKAFITQLQSALSEKARLLKVYLTSKGIDTSADGRLLISDIGWRGSIQDNLSYLMPQKEIFGSYLGLLPLLNPQPLQVFKAAYGPNYMTEKGRMWEMLTGITFLELITNTDTGSALGYREHDGKITVLKKDLPEENDVYRTFTTYFQQGVLEAVPAIAQVVSAFGISSLEARPYALELTEAMMLRPERILTRAYFSLVHNDTFGDARELDMKKLSGLPLWQMLLAPLVPAVFRSVMHKADRSMWHNGFFIYNDPTGLFNRYILLRKQIRRKLTALRIKVSTYRG